MYFIKLKKNLNLSVVIMMMSSGYFSHALGSDQQESTKVIGTYINKKTNDKIEYRCSSIPCAEYDIILIKNQNEEIKLASKVNSKMIQERAAHYQHKEKLDPMGVKPYLTSWLAEASPSAGWWDDLGPGVIFLVPAFIITGAVDLVTDVPLQLVKYLSRKEHIKRSIHKKIYYPEGKDQYLADRVFKKIVDELTVVNQQIETLRQIKTHNEMKVNFQFANQIDKEKLNSLSNLKIVLKIKDLEFANELLQKGTSKYISYDTFDYYYNKFNTSLFYGSLDKLQSGISPSLPQKISYLANDPRAIEFSHQNIYCAFESFTLKNSPVKFSSGQIFQLESSELSKADFQISLDYSDSFYPRTGYVSKEYQQMSKIVLNFNEKNNGGKMIVNCVSDVNNGVLSDAPFSRLMLALYGVASINIERSSDSWGLY